MQRPVPRRLCVAEFLESAAPLAACGAHSGDANRTSQNGNRRTMTTVDIHRHASHKPLHAGDMESVLWGIEKDPLLRQTMTAVLILDRPPDRETLLDRIERASRNIPAGDQTVYLAGAKVVALYPFGPLMGTARTAACWGTTTGHMSGSTLMRQPCRIWTCSPGASVRASTPSSQSPTSANRKVWKLKFADQEQI